MKVKRFFAVLISFLSVFIFLFCGCKSKKMNLSEDLFDEKVLEYYNLSWLIKPEGAENEAFETKGNADNPAHHYSCDIENYEEFKNYALYVFNALKSGGYNVARFIRRNDEGSLFDYRYWYEVADSDKLEDYCKSVISEEGSWYRYEFYFSTKKLGKYEDKYHGQKMKGSCWIILRYDLDEGNDSNCYINVGYEDTDVYLITDELYLMKLLNYGF